MARLEDLREKVDSLYEKPNDGRAEWADWIYPNHVVIVANKAKTIAKEVGANVELSEVAALLHDIADIEMKRENPEHESRSLTIARQLMSDYGYSTKDTSLVVDDAIKFHSCYGNERPKSKEGLVLATADALAHLQTDYYVFATWNFGKKESLEETKEWVLKKIKRDFNNKISFENIREQARPDYEMIKILFSR